MRTTINLDDETVKTAMEYSGIKDRSALIHLGLQQIIEKEAARRLAALAGAQPDFMIPGFALDENGLAYRIAK